MRKILHIASLARIGGHETALCDFLESDFIQRKAMHHVYALGNKIHPHLKIRLDHTPSSVTISRSVMRFNVPRAVSKIIFNRLIKNHRPELIIFWNSLGSLNFTWLFQSKIPYIHYERGNAAGTPYDLNKLEFLNGARLIIANSFSSSRHIALRYKPETVVEVCLNGLSGMLAKHRVNPGKFSKDRPFRLGCCGRLVSIKGVAVAVQAVKILNEAGCHVELHIAGTGPEESHLFHLSQKLDIGRQVVFHGLLKSEELISFYETIDLLVMPSIRESFPRASLEAQYMGCPVIVSKVDGAPETIVEGKTGYSLSPVLDVEEYMALGGTGNNLPQAVYNPDIDALIPPRVLSPEHLADKIALLMQNPDLYQRLSANAHEIAVKRFDYNAHIRKLWSIIEKASDGQP